MKNPDIRWKQRFHSFRKAFVHLSQAVQLREERGLSNLEEQGLIQAFEFTHELAWKTLKDFLQNRGTIEIHGSKDATREAFATGLIEDGEIWMDMIQSRNQTTHTYNLDTAGSIAGSIVERYFEQFRQFEKRFAELEKKDS